MVAVERQLQAPAATAAAHVQVTLVREAQQQHHKQMRQCRHEQRNTRMSRACHKLRACQALRKG